MPKLKTQKSVAKRFKITGGKKKKIIKRSAGQDHFNARESGKTVRNKRRDKTVSKADEKNIRSFLPYN